MCMVPAPPNRITHEDLDAFISGARSGGGAAASAPVLRLTPKREGVEEVKVIGMRRAIARQMQESKRRIPHFAYIEEVDMTEVEELRVHLNAAHKEQDGKLTVLPFIMRALVKVLPAYPQINAIFRRRSGGGASLQPGCPLRHRHPDARRA